MFNLSFAAASSSASSNGNNNVDDNPETVDAEVKDPASATAGAPKRKRSRRRRKPKSRTKVEPLQASSPNNSNADATSHVSKNSKKKHDAPMGKRDLYFALDCEMVGIGPDGRHSAVARVTIVNWENQIVLDTFVQVPVPVTDFRTHISGIRPEDITSDKAMTFAQVRSKVESILSGKILIGHGLDCDLATLSLTHPYCDTRDTAKYSAFMVEYRDPATGAVVGMRPGKLRDLAFNVLKRSIQDPSRPHCPVEDCVAALDLYKAVRAKWEQDLVQVVHQAEKHHMQQQQQQLERYQPVDTSVPYATAGGRASYCHPRQYSHSLQQPNETFVPVQQNTYELPHHNYSAAYDAGNVSRQPSIPVHEGTLPSQSGPHPSAPHHLRDQTQLQFQQPIPQNQSSWFRFSGGTSTRTKHSRHSHHHQQSSLAHSQQMAQGLSQPALEVLSGHDDLQMNEPSLRNDSMCMEVASDYSSVYNESDTCIRRTETEPSDADGSVYLEGTDSSSGHTINTGYYYNQSTKSWFSFGGRRGRMVNDQRPMTSVYELPVHDEAATKAVDDLVEPQQGSNFNELTNEKVECVAATAAASIYEPPTYFESEVPEKASSSWFGFRRARSPRRRGSMTMTSTTGTEPPKKTDDNTAHSVETVVVVADDSDENLPEPEIDADGIVANDDTEEDTSLTPSSNVEAATKDEKPTSWFGFRRTKSPRRRSSLLMAATMPEDVMIEQALNEEKDDGNNDDENWLHEVMHSDGSEHETKEAFTVCPDVLDDVDAVIADEAFVASGSALAGGAENHFDSQVSKVQKEKESNWFRFLNRSKTSSSRKVSRLAVAETSYGSEDEKESNTERTVSFDDDGWMEEVVSFSPNSSSDLGLEPSWFQSRKIEEPPEVAPISKSSNTKTNSASTPQIDFGSFYTRSRLCTESTIPSVASDDQADDFEENKEEPSSFMEGDVLFDIVQGMEQNFHYLNL